MIILANNPQKNSSCLTLELTEQNSFQTVQTYFIWCNNQETVCYNKIVTVCSAIHKQVVLRKLSSDIADVLE